MAPAATPKVPTAQLVQLFELDMSAKRPAAQLVHAVAASIPEYSPTAHGGQTVAPAGAYNPAAQPLQVLAPVPEYSPAPQLEHAEVARPVAVEYSPAAQLEHAEVSRPITVENIPTVQLQHAESSRPVLVE